MRLLSVAFFACASLFASSLADPDAGKWYAIYNGGGSDGIIVLDSNKANIEAMTGWASLDDVKGDTGDKGIRFQYSPVTKFVTNEAHKSKFVGIKDKNGDNRFKANIGDDKDNVDRLVRATFYEVDDGKWEVSLCLNFDGDKPKDCIGANGFRANDSEYKWKLMEISSAS